MVPMNPSINRNSEKLFEDLRREMPKDGKTDIRYSRV